MYLDSTKRRRLEDSVERKLGFKVWAHPDSQQNATIIEGRGGFDEFLERVPDLLLMGLKRYDQLAELFERRWRDVKPEIFLDVTTNRIGVRAPYLPDFINEIKVFIPPSARSWDSLTKTWYVNPTYMDQIERIVRKYFPDVTVTTPGQDMMPVDGDIYSRLLHPLPDFALKSVYRAIAIACHPDRAGVNGISVEQATELMQTVNIVWEEIKKARGWKT